MSASFRSINNINVAEQKRPKKDEKVGQPLVSRWSAVGQQKLASKTTQAQPQGKTTCRPKRAVNDL